MILWAFTFHGHFTEFGRFYLHLNGAHVFVQAEFVNGLVADIAELGDDSWLVKRNDEHSTCICHTSGDIRGIRGVEQSHVGKLQRQTVLIDNPAGEMAVGLVGTLHIDLIVFALGHADGIEADELLDGFGH